MHSGTIGKARVFPPSDPLVMREFAGPLALKKNDGLSEGISVIVGGNAMVAVAAERVACAAGVGVAGEVLQKEDKKNEC